MTEFSYIVLKLFFMMATFGILFLHHITLNEPISFILMMYLFIKIIIEILILLDGSDDNVD
jgi:hypothetical protein